jgi:phosphohistidine phosphatase SixA
MKHLVVVRHGGYDSSGITEEGRQQTRELAASLTKKFGGDCKPIVLASDAKRARQTGEIIAEHFGVQAEARDELNIDEYHDHHGLVAKAMEIIRQKAEGHDVVIVVTHYATTVALPKGFFEEFLGKQIDYLGEADYSHAHILDCETGELLANFC